MTTKQTTCPHLPELSLEEQKAMDWLYHTLRNIIQKKGHRSKENARLVTEVLVKLIDAMESMHERVHVLEDLNMRDYLDSEELATAIATARLAVQRKVGSV